MLLHKRWLQQSCEAVLRQLTLSQPAHSRVPSAWPVGNLAANSRIHPYRPATFPTVVISMPGGAGEQHTGAGSKSSTVELPFDPVPDWRRPRTAKDCSLATSMTTLLVPSCKTRRRVECSESTYDLPDKFGELRCCIATIQASGRLWRNWLRQAAAG